MKHLSISRKIGLSGEQWQILAALGELYRTNGAEEKAQQALAQAAEIVQALAAKIDDESLWAEFLTAKPIRRVLAAGGSE